MAARKSINLLPSVFQTDANKKFLAATVDQLIQDPQLRKLHGYIGRQFAPTVKSTDSYVIENDADRQNYQLEPSTLIRDEQGNTVFFSSYIDFINKIEYYGGLVNDHSRLFSGEYYTFDPSISFDKFVNFAQYYWLPNGPSAVQVNTSGVELRDSFTVARNTSTKKYNFTSKALTKDALVLARGGTYTFQVNQPGIPFWIQTELGIDGRVSSATTLSARDVLGVTNNGEDLGEITFNVPQKDSQDRYIKMETVYNVEYATPSAFKDLHNQTITDFLAKYPQYAGITGTIDGKTLIFVDQEPTDDPWIVEGRDDNVSIGYDKGDMVPDNKRYGVWKIQTIDLECKLELTNTTSANVSASLGDYITIPSINANVRVLADSIITANTVGNVSIDSITAISNVALATGNVYLNGNDTGLTVSDKFVVRAPTLDVVVDRLINLFWLQDVEFDQKVYVKYGVGNANKEFYKEFDGIFHRVPLLSSLLDTLYIQDSLDPNIYATIKIVDFTNFTIDVDADILGRTNYTSPNGVTFTSGLKIEFGEDVTPTKYQSRQYYVENVGDKIRLVDTELLITPETYNEELAINYPIQRIVLDTPTVDNIAAGSTVSFGGYTVTTNTIIPTGSINITTLDDVGSITKGMLVSGTGIADGTIVYDIYPDTVFPDYITIKRDAIDLNAWSRNNRWFHIDVIKSAAEFNNENLIFDQKLRAQRPIVQFEGDLQLFNNGRIGKQHIDILDTDFNDAFSTLEGQTLTSVFGIEIFDGLRVIFASDTDPLVKDKIYLIRLVQYKVDSDGLPTGPYSIKLELADDSEPQLYDTLVVKSGKYKGSQWWYNGSTWTESQQKTSLQQDPLFDVFDNNDVSLSDINVYPRTSFTGTKIFGYDRSNSTTIDPILGFPLKYRSFQSQGDILFANYFNTETFSYVQGPETITENVNVGFFKNIVDRETVTIRNSWKTAKEYSKQYQIFKFIYDGTNNLFTLDVTPAESSTIPYVRVYQNETYLREDQWTISYANGISLLTALTAGDVINVEVFSYQSSYQGAYQVPLNLDLNAQNLDLTSLTLGQVRNHLLSLNRNSRDVIGNILGPCNLRDIELKAQGGSILQHSAPLPYAQLFLLDEQANLIESVRYAQREYSKFRNKFFELSTTLGGIDVNDPIGGVDKILTEINKNKNSSFPWFYSDMVPYGTLKNEITYTVFDPLISSYEISQVFSTEMLSNSAVLVYLTPSTKIINTIDTTTDGVTLRLESVYGVYPGMIVSGPDLTVLEQVSYIYVEEIIDEFTVTLSGRVTILGDKELTFTGVKLQLTLGFDYTFDADRPAVTFNTNNITLGVDDIITIVEYQNTDGCYIPETPTKLGIYPKYIPEAFLDDTYRNPTKVIRGHDGSLTPSFGDYRDAFLLELELRIYNNIKLPDTGTYADIFAVVPGKFRDSEYTYQELWQVLSKTFLSWVGNNKVDYSTNSTFLANDPFTWNYSNCVDVIDGEYLPGSWRACYMYFYDTFYPHTRPWEMLGFATKPDWWEGFYGPGPYTGGNELLWNDLEAGLIRFGPRSTFDDGYGPGVDVHYIRPGLSQIIPVDENGFLLSPSAILAKSVNPTRSAGAWSVGQLGPVEYAWRSSVDFPFAAQIAFALAKPAVYFGQFADTYKIQYNYSLNQYLTLNNQHIKQSELTFNGDTSQGFVNRGAGYLNWIADYLTSLGINPATKITPMLKNFQVNLAYKMAGFSDKKYLQVLAEQSSPSSTNASVMIPDENYEVLLYKSTPVDKLVYSAVIVEKNTNGYSVRGYDLNNPYFTIIPSIVNNNRQSISVLNGLGVIYGDYERTKLTVPYGYEFTSPQQVVDFLISYERYLLAQGFTFNDLQSEMGEVQNWRLAAKEFLFWSQQGWKPGAIIVLSPVASSINAITVGSIVDGIEDSQYGSKVVDQNFNLVKSTSYNVMRTPTEFKLTLLEDTSVIAFVELNLVQYEHVLVFDNTTVFNDVIYKPELGNRQYRLKLIGQKTDNWDGSLSAPGFIYNSKTIQAWAAGKDYLKGDLVTYKNQYYVALQNTAAANEFGYVYWKQLTNSEIQVGLLNDFSTIAVGSQSFYDSYGYIQNDDQLKYSHGLIGFKPRQYLDDLGMSETTQIELYKGYIKQKGTKNAIDALADAVFNDTSSSIGYFEEWAVRTGEYGALGSNPYVEIALDEKAFSVNPATAEFVGVANNNEGDGVTVFNKSQLFRSTDQYDGNIALVRDEHSNYDNDIPLAGYVNIDDVDTTIFDLADYTLLDTDLENIGSGYTIWTAKDFRGNWNVFRVSETDNFVVSLSNEFDDNGDITGYIIWETQTPHGLRESDIFLVRTFNTAFNGFYQVDQISAINQIRVIYLGATENLDDLGDVTLTGLGLFYKLDSLRFLYMEDARIYGYNGNPKHGWQVGEKIWIDEDAATSLIQGQQFDTPSGGWKVYEKTEPWSYSQTIIPDVEDIKQNTGFGKDVKLSYDGLLAVAGNPGANTEQIWSANVSTGDYIPIATGKVHVYNKGLGESFVEGTPLTPNAGNAMIRTSEFGFSVDQSIDHVGVGAPGSYGNVGFVYVYSKTSGTSAFSNPQIVWSGNLRANVDRFGSSIAFDEQGRWLYVGAPGNAAVYVYGLNTHVETYSQLTPVGNVNTLLLNATIVANVGDVITQPSVGSETTVKVATGSGGNSRIQVSTLTNIVTGVGPGSIYINGIQLSGSRYISSTQTDQVQQTIDLEFVPSVANEANLLVISTPARTFIPGIDYTLSANTVTFKEKLIEGAYSIEQRPYYALQNVLYGPPKSQFGYALDSSLDGAQLGVGAPNDSVTVNGNAIVGAGAVYVYDRVIEAFETTGSTIYTTSGNIDLAHRVTIDDIEVDGYDTWLTDPILAKNKVRFIDAPITGKVVYIESNQFNLLERLIGIDNLEGGLSAIQANAAFGTSLTICSNNCAIYVGAPYYNNYPQYTTGAVWKFHNRGRLYGVNTGYALNPTFIPGDTIRLDNFEVTVGGRMMPSDFNLTDAASITGIPEIYVSANILTLSSSVLANVGQRISQNLGSGYYANVTVLANTAITGSQTIIVGGNAASGTYTLTGNTFNFSYSSAANVRIGNVTVTSAWPARPVASLDSLVKDINDADILGVSAVNQNGYLTLTSNKTIAKNLLRILSGSNSQGGTGVSNVYSSADLAIFGFMQIIVNPYNAQAEYFGSKVVLAQNAYMLVIASDRGTTRSFATFDSATTIFDDRSTVFFDAITGSGSVYIYELYDDPRDDVEHPGRYAFAQQLNTGSLQTGDRFGTSIDIIGSTVIASSPSDDTVTYITLNIGLTLSVGDVLVLSSTTAPNFYFAPYTVQLDYLDSSTIWVSPNSSVPLEKGSGYRISILRGGDTNNLESTDAYITDIVENTGSIFIFSNPTLKRGWNLIRYQQPKVDIESVNRMYLYNNLTNTILTNLQFIDPAKGKILGQADQEITYKTIYDPATYNRGNTSKFNINNDTYWGANQVEQVWWNLDQVRFIDYEQGSLVYRSVNWGRLFPGSVIEVCEWVESTVLPSQYVAAGNDGIPKYSDNSAYVEIIFVDPVTNIIGSKYYFWVTGKTSVTGNNPKRQLPIQTIADYISNPKSQGISYSAVIQNNAAILYNVGDYLSASNTILHIDYEIIKNNSIIHSEYELLQKDNPVSFIPTKISNKLLDSLAGLDSSDSVVPDPKLNVADRYGVSIRPRQSMFVDRLRAMRDLVDYVNAVLLDKPIARQYDLTQLNTEEEKPNFKLGEYDLEVDTEVDLGYIDITSLEEGYKVLVNNDTTQDNLWVLYRLDADKQWTIDRVQSYKTNLYWEYVDWFAYKADGVTRYSLDDKLDFVVPTIVDAKKLSATPGEEILVRVSIGSVGLGWNLLVVNDKGDLVLVGIENGTIQLKPSLGNFADNGIGFDAQGYTVSRFDQNPNKETRYIISALKDDIFVGELQGEYNKLFFVMMNYLFTEQKYVDWIFKTSFISITHFLRELAQPANYIKDNITYYEEYINEVKPYITKIREYLTNYKGNDVFEGGITDFDLPAYYDPELGIFRSPSGRYPAKDQQLWATGYLTSTGQLINQDYPQWYSNRHNYVAEIIVEEAGAGYTSAPIVYVSGGTSDEANYALATAHVNYSMEGEVVLSSADNITGEGLSRVVITSQGAGYSQGATANVEAASNGGVRANVDITIFESNGRIATATVSEFGTNYLTVPFVTVVKPPAANVAVTLWYGNISGNIMTVSTTSNIYVGMRTNLVAFGSATVTSVWAGNSNVQLSRGNTATVGSNISFYDQGAGAELTALLTETYLGLYPTHLENNLVILSGNVTALVGEVIYQPSTGARSIITANVINTDRFPVSYLDANVFALGLPAGRITSISLDYQGRDYVTTPMVIINGGADVDARAYAVLKNSQVRTFDTTIKFDRVSYGTTVEQWTPYTTYAANTIVSYQGQGYLVSNTITTGTEFVTSDYTLYDPAGFKNANDRIMAYYSPKTTMPAKDLNQLVPGVEYPGVQVQGLNFNQGPGYSGETTANLTFSNNVALAVGDLVSQTTADTIIKLDWPVSATVGSYIYQPSSGANAIIYGENILGGNVVESSTVYLIKSSGADFTTSGNITIAGVLQTHDQIIGNVLTSVEIKPQTVNIGSASYIEIPISTPSVTVTKIWSPKVIQGRINTTADFVFSNTSITGGNIAINGIISNVYPTALDYISSADEISAFDETIFDQVDYDEDGNPILSEATVDSLIRSYYTDEALGTRPEDINVDGGAYIDRYSSHAPEELIPGITFDTLDMRVFTNVYGNILTLSGNVTVNVGDYIIQPTTGANALVLATTTANSRVLFSYVAGSNVFVEDTTTSTVSLVDGANVANVTSLNVYVDSVGTKLAYRLFKNMMGYHNYIRISDKYTTNLSRELLVDDTEIHVVNALNLSGANPTLAFPGVVYINGERITYYRNYALDVVTWQNNTYYNEDSILSYGNIITLSGAITANRGDYITQASGGANVMITANVVNQTNVSVYYTSANTITFGSGIVEIVSGPNTANVTTTTVYPTISYPAYYKSTGNVQGSTFNYFNVEPIASLNVLSQIRRGTQGTGAANVYPLGALVIDGSQRQNIPDTTLGSRTGVFGEVQLVTADEFDSTNSNISLNSDNNLVTNISTVVGSSIIKAYVGQTGNIGNLQIGDIVTGFINNTSVTVSTVYASSNILTVSSTVGLYVGMSIFDPGYPNGAIIIGINDPESNVTLSNANIGTVVSNTVVFSEVVNTSILAIRNVYRNTDTTTVAIDANITVTTANIWLNPGDNILNPADGTGFEGSLSVPVQFLKELTGGRAAYAASLGDAILQEGTNLIALLDESGNAIIIE